jgi:hypothetical protein
MWLANTRKERGLYNFGIPFIFNTPNNYDYNKHFVYNIQTLSSSQLFTAWSVVCELLTAVIMKSIFQRSSMKFTYVALHVAYFLRSVLFGYEGEGTTLCYS